MKEKIRKILLDLGAGDCGFAKVDRFNDIEMGFNPKDVYPDAKTVISFLLPLPIGVKYTSPRLVYNHVGDIVKAELDRICYLASLEIEKLGIVAMPLPSDGPYDYWVEEKKEGKGIISMKDAAVKSGLGAIGKSSVFISKKYGTLVNLGAILINYELDSDELCQELCIEGCSLCIDNCPAKAIKDKKVNQLACRNNTYETNKRGFSVCKCNTCVTICPRANIKREYK